MAGAPSPHSGQFGREVGKRQEPTDMSWNPLFALVASDLSDEWVLQKLGLYHGVKPTHLDQESEKLKEDPGKVIRCKPGSCCTPTR